MYHQNNKMKNSNIVMQRRLPPTDFDYPVHLHTDSLSVSHTQPICLTCTASRNIREMIVCWTETPETVRVYGYSVLYSIFDGINRNIYFPELHSYG